MARRGEARLGLAGGARRGSAGRDKERHGLARQGRCSTTWVVISIKTKINKKETQMNVQAVISRNGRDEKVKAEGKVEALYIPALRERTLPLRIVGIAPYMQLRFSQKAINIMTAKHMAGGQAKVKKNREARDFNQDYLDAMHKMGDGTIGIPASSLRSACVSACRLVGFKMTIAKLSLFFEADGFDVVDGMPLIKIEGTPEKSVMAVRNATGVIDLRCRPMWRNWSANIRVRFDEDQLSAQDIVNLVNRAGKQVGIGEGRPDSKESCGIGFGLFKIDLAGGEKNA